MVADKDRAQHAVCALCVIVQVRRAIVDPVMEAPALTDRHRVRVRRARASPVPLPYLDAEAVQIIHPQRQPVPGVGLDRIDQVFRVEVALAVSMGFGTENSVVQFALRRAGKLATCPTALRYEIEFSGRRRSILCWDLELS